MSVVIRRVPAGWEHPEHADEQQHTFGEHVPMNPEPWSEALDEWRDDEENSLRMLTGDEELNPTTYSPPPDPVNHMPETDEPKTHFQLYEEVSYGTPLSPVFAAPEEIVDWMAGKYVGQADTGEIWTREAAARFVDAALADLV